MNFMQQSSSNKLSIGNAFSYTPSYNSNCSSAASSNCSSYESDHDHFHYDSEDADTNLMVGQALHYCEATRGAQKKQFNNA
jgi:hypothetical protein